MRAQIQKTKARIVSFYAILRHKYTNVKLPLFFFFDLCAHLRLLFQCHARESLCFACREASLALGKLLNNIPKCDVKGRKEESSFFLSKVCDLT